MYNVVWMNLSILYCLILIRFFGCITSWIFVFFLQCYWRILSFLHCSWSKIYKPLYGLKLFFSNMLFEWYNMVKLREIVKLWTKIRCQVVSLAWSWMIAVLSSRTILRSHRLTIELVRSRYDAWSLVGLCNWRCE